MCLKIHLKIHQIWLLNVLFKTNYDGRILTEFKLNENNNENENEIEYKTIANDETEIKNVLQPRMVTKMEKKSWNNNKPIEDDQKCII